MVGRFNEAYNDVAQGFLSISLWVFLAWQETKQRYRRSILGPLWITISMGVMLGAIGPLYGKLLGQPLGPYFQNLAIGFVLWNFISGSINESCAAFISSEAFIKQIKLPFSIYILKILAKNIIIFGHNVIIIIVVFVIFPPGTFSGLPLAIIGFVLVLINLVWIGFVLSLICTRFRDVSQLVANFMQVLFFLTPVLWNVRLLGDKRGFAEWNFFYHLISVIRDPLLGVMPSTKTWLIITVASLWGSLTALIIFSRYRFRISYWI